MTKEGNREGAKQDSNYSVTGEMKKQDSKIHRKLAIWKCLN